MQKVLGKESRRRLWRSASRRWLRPSPVCDVHKAIKWFKVRPWLATTHPQLMQFGQLLKESRNKSYCWDVARASAHITSQAANKKRGCIRVQTDQQTNIYGKKRANMFFLSFAFYEPLFEKAFLSDFITISH